MTCPKSLYNVDKAESQNYWKCDALTIKTNTILQSMYSWLASNFRYLSTREFLELLITISLSA